jgi:hypothetical protein
MASTKVAILKEKIRDLEEEVRYQMARADEYEAELTEIKTVLRKAVGLE